MKHMLILGAGTGGTIMANLLAKHLPPAAWDLTVIDGDMDHYYQPGFLFVPFGMYTKEQVRRPKADYLPRRAQFIAENAVFIDAKAQQITLAGGQTLPYDVLVIASGCTIAMDETPGMLDGYGKTIFDFYTYEGALSLASVLPSFTGGSIVMHVNEMPIKCPIAPLEFIFLADWYFSRKKIRNDVRITFVTPLSGAFTKPIAAKMLGSLIEKKHIDIVADFGTERIDADAKKLIGYNGREIPYDMLVTVPTNKGSEVIERSGLGDDLRFVPTDNNTLVSKQFPNVFVIGDATNVPASKAGSVVHFEAETVLENILHFITGVPLAPSFDGHANCFIETGYGKGILIDFNYEQEPVPGLFPLPIGPLTLLSESPLNHFGKLAFEWIYWNMLLKGIPIPFIPRRMSRAGKQFPAVQK
ncbi:MAG: FAD/NAD(P)-binding oxidoreductase [Spirochaetota bacterium]